MGGVLFRGRLFESMPKDQNFKQPQRSKNKNNSSKTTHPKPDVILKRKVLQEISNYPTIKDGIKMGSKKLNLTERSLEGMYYRYRKNGGNLNGNQMLTDDQN